MMMESLPSLPLQDPHLQANEMYMVLQITLQYNRKNNPQNMYPILYYKAALITVAGIMFKFPMQSKQICDDGAYANN